MAFGDGVSGDGDAVGFGDGVSGTKTEAVGNGVGVSATKGVGEGVSDSATEGVGDDEVVTSDFLVTTKAAITRIPTKIIPDPNTIANGKVRFPEFLSFCSFI